MNSLDHDGLEEAILYYLKFIQKDEGATWPQLITYFAAGFGLRRTEDAVEFLNNAKYVMFEDPTDEGGYVICQLTKLGKIAADAVAASPWILRIFGKQ